MSGSTDWLSAIGILLSGLVLGFMFIYAQLRKKSAAARPDAPDLELLDLEAKRNALIQQLREIDDAGENRREERKQLEIETAAVLRAIDEHRAYQPAAGATAAAPATATDARIVAPPVSTGFFDKHPEIKGFVWGAASIAALSFLGYYVYHSSAQKTAGQSMAGGEATTSDPHPRGAGASDPVVKQLEAAVQSDPNNIDRRIDLARAYLDRENMMGVFEQTKAVLDRNPNEPRAQTYNAIVRMAMGQLDSAKGMLESATRTDPKLVDAWVAIAWIDTQKGDKTAGRAAIAEAIRNSPENEARLEEVWTQMSTQPGQPAAMGASERPRANGEMPASLPPAHPPIDSHAPAPAAGSASTAPDAIRLTLLLDAAARTKTGVLYVMARPAGQDSGMPIAVKRISAATFPLYIEISSADSMLGQPLPPKVSIEARLDADGDASTKAPTDPHAFADGVTAGTKLAMTLK
jgi:tetratricopeptide (TPR) repeat protein